MNDRLQVAVRHVDGNHDLETRVREHFETVLDGFPRLTLCRVTIEAPSAHHRQGSWQVAVESHLPGVEVPVLHEKSSDVEDAIHASAKALKKKLREINERIIG